MRWLTDGVSRHDNVLCNVGCGPAINSNGDVSFIRSWSSTAAALHGRRAGVRSSAVMAGGTARDDDLM